MEETKHQDEEEVTRRSLLKTACIAGAGAAVLISGLNGRADASGGTYPQVRIANVKDVKAGKAVKFDYPLAGRKNILINCGCSTEGGVGAEKSIVAYSSFCTHLGCGVDIEKESGMLVCECHQSIYDPKQSGKVVEGPAPNSLPMVALNVDKNGDIYAVGVAGLIYGMRNNLLDGEEVK
ncbi:MAG: arsenate reductase (azurin) small subunit [Nitrospiraceae bacterium]|nr:MAG: arsenate reductase (azurin) small subunit [Nitrospiraceae bacterium]